MHVSLDQFGLAIETPLAVPTSRCYRPPSWPPPRGWVCIEDQYGNEVAKWEDHIWPFYPWTGNNDSSINFGDGPQLNSRSHQIDPANADILRELVGWRLWGPRGAKNISSLLTGFVEPIRKVIALCSQHKILVSNLSRYPALIEEVARSMAPSSFAKVVAELDRLRDAREFLGFELLDQAGIQRLKAAQPDHNPGQTEYIPSRIWTCFVMRLKECLDDYLAHQQQIEACFAFCVDAYEKNGVKEDRMGKKQSKRIPFQNPTGRLTGKRSGIAYLGPFGDTAQRFGIRDALERWVGRLEGGRGIAAFSKYLSLIQYAGLADVLSFTLMRVAEGVSIRKNCLVWHDDAVYGLIPLIQAETTKTDPDENALWITSPSVEPAIRALNSVARMRLSCVGEWTDAGNHYLINDPVEPWSRPKKAEMGLRPRARDLNEVVSKLFPGPFDLQQLTITEEDLKIARAVSPTLNRDLFQVGTPWRLAWHQLRRTGAVNMFASGDISDSSMQLQMKHLTRWMPLYYGRGNTSLHLNEATRVLLVNAQYEAMGRQLAAVQTDRFVSPYGDDHKEKLLSSASDETPVNLISEDDAASYEKAARQYHISFRRTVLGGCMKNGACDGDCVSSVGDCAGGDGKEPCSNVLFDRNRAESNQIRLDGVVKQLEITPPDTPRYRHLEQERRGLENYFVYINRP
ncbi:MAG: hypothetical protein PHQ05_02565 [Sterolibacterium sp.]|nr:hypothetical protein [Sterolibacterium sp.]